MPVFYGYSNVILGSQSTANGSAIDYNFAPPAGQNWQYTGPTTSFHVRENDGATLYNGDVTNEQVGANEQVGGTWEQLAFVNGSYQQTIWDYTFEITAPDGTVLRVAVIDIDFNNDDDLNDAGEDGYFLIFPDGVPDPGVNYTIGGIVENDGSTPHTGLGATIVCFASDTLIDTPAGPVPVQHLSPGDTVLTRDDGPQELIWTGARRVDALGDFAPIVITAGTYGNSRDLIVSPQHRILITGWQAQLHFGAEEVLVKAKDLVDGKTVYRRDGGKVTYHHILCDAHQVVRANGAWAESFHLGPNSLPALDDGPRRELLKLFPDLGAEHPPKVAAAHMSLKGYEAALLS